jgi:hypothetical protein
MVLPANADLRQLKNRAKDLVKAHTARAPELAHRLRQALPEWSDLPDEQVFEASFALKNAQRAIAREYGFDQWADLKRHIEFRSDAESAGDLYSRANSGAGLRTFRRGRSEANQLLRAFRKGDVQAIDRVRAAVRASLHVRKALPVNADEKAEINHPHDAVQVIAHEQSGSSWAAMCLETENANALILDPEHAFINALRENDLAEVRRFLADDAKLANARVRGAAWHLAGTAWEAGADGPGKVPEDDQRTTTPLHHASVTGKAGLAQLLVEFGADVNGLGFQDNCDISPPIILAAWEGDLETMRVLLEAGADPNLGGNALFTTLEHGRRTKPKYCSNTVARMTSSRRRCTVMKAR